LIEASEKILKVYLYKTPLTDWQFTNELLHHAYIVFETDQWWWSIEKNSEGLTIPRAKTFDAVGRRYRQSERTGMDYFGLQLIWEDEGRKTMNELVDFIYSKNLLNRNYNWVFSNCKRFAIEIFNFVAKNKTITPSIDGNSYALNPRGKKCPGDLYGTVL